MDSSLMLSGVQLREPVPDAPAPVDHRTLVGKKRRAKTELKIIEAALHVFAQKGPDAPVIEDFINQAGIARGTFYNYYKSIDELLAATSMWIGNDAAKSIEAKIGSSKDPVYRLSTGVRLWMQKAQADPEWCAFVHRVGGVGDLVRKRVIKDLKRGLDSGLFRFPSIEAALDLVIGTVLQGMQALIEHRGRRNFGDEVARIVLQGLGVEPHRIEKVTGIPLPDMRDVA